MSDSLALGDLCAAIVDCEHKTAQESPEGPCWSVGTTAIAGNRIDLRAAKRISEVTYRAWTRRAVPVEGDLILAREAPVGLVARIPSGVRVALGQRTVLLRPDPKQIEPRFLHYLLQSPAMQQQLLMTAEGSTVPHLNVADIRITRVPPLPQRRVQAGIAETLGAVDDRIESNRRRSEYGDALLDTLSGCLTGLPSVALGDLVDSERRVVDPALQGARLVDHFSLPAFDAGRMADIVPGVAIKSSKQVVYVKSILVSRLNPRIDRTWFAVPRSDVLAVASSEFLALRPRAGVTFGALWLAVRWVEFRMELIRRATGTSGSHQRVRPADALAIHVPDIRLIDPELAAEAESLLETIHQARVESQTLTELRDVLLPELLSGRLEVPEAREFAEV